MNEWKIYACNIEQITSNSIDIYSNLFVKEEKSKRNCKLILVQIKLPIKFTRFVVHMTIKTIRNVDIILTFEEGAAAAASLRRTVKSTVAQSRRHSLAAWLPSSYSEQSILRKLIFLKLNIQNNLWRLSHLCSLASHVLLWCFLYLQFHCLWWAVKEEALHFQSNEYKRKCFYS